MFLRFEGSLELIWVLLCPSAGGVWTLRIHSSSRNVWHYSGILWNSGIPWDPGVCEHPSGRGAFPLAECECLQGLAGLPFGGAECHKTLPVPGLLMGLVTIKEFVYIWKEGERGGPNPTGFCSPESQISQPQVQTGTNSFNVLVSI